MSSPSTGVEDANEGKTYVRICNWALLLSTHAFPFWTQDYLGYFFVSCPPSNPELMSVIKIISKNHDCLFGKGQSCTLPYSTCFGTRTANLHSCTKASCLVEYFALSLSKVNKSRLVRGFFFNSGVAFETPRKNYMEK